MMVCRLEAKSSRKKIMFEWNYFLLAFISIAMQHASIYHHHLNYYCFSIIFTSIILISFRILFVYYKTEKVLSPTKTTTRTYLLVSVMAVLAVDLLYMAYKIQASYTLLPAISIYSPQMLYAYMFGLLFEERYTDPKNEMYRILKISMYSAIELAFHCGFIPIRFLCKKDTLVIRTQEILTNAFFIFARTFVYMLSHLFYNKIGELSCHAKLTGKWNKILEAKNWVPWVDGITYPMGTVVKEKGELFEAVGERNSGKPGDVMNNLLYMMFSSPNETLKIMSHMIYAMILVEFVLMMWLKCYAERAIGMLVSMFIFFQILNDRDKLKKHEC